MAKTGDVVMVPLGTLVAVLETGNVHVKIPTKDTGRPSEDFEVIEFSKDFLRYVKLDGAAPSHPIALPPDAPGTPSHPIVIPGTPSHPIALPPAKPDNTLPGPGPARPDNTLPGGSGGRPDNTLPANPGTKPDNTLPATPGTKPDNTLPPTATPKK